MVSFYLILFAAVVSGLGLEPSPEDFQEIKFPNDRIPVIDFRIKNAHVLPVEARDHIPECASHLPHLSVGDI